MQSYRQIKEQNGKIISRVAARKIVAVIRVNDQGIGPIGDRDNRALADIETVREAVSVHVE
jgi:hypothetical protein